jgi:hypothetical protein
MAHISPYLDTPEAAVYLHLAPKSLVNMRSLHIGPKFSRAGKGRILYHIEDIENWVVRVDHIKPEVA